MEILQNHINMLHLQQSHYKKLKQSYNRSYWFMFWFQIRKFQYYFIIFYQSKSMKVLQVLVLICTLNLHCFAQINQKTDSLSSVVSNDNPLRNYHPTGPPNNQLSAFGLGLSNQNIESSIYKKPTQIIVEPQYPIDLGSDSMTLFPYLRKQFTLEKAQNVEIAYKIMAQFPDETPLEDQHIVTYLFIDRQQNTRFRSITGNTIYVDNSARQRVWLEAGTHKVEVRYKSPGRIAELYQSDWNNIHLRITYY